MKILLDSHAFVWLVLGDKRLSRRAKQVIDTSIVVVSAVTAWELATKVRRGKWPDVEALSTDLPKVLDEFGFETLPVSIAHAQLAGSMVGSHKDPFDRMLAAQAIHENIGLVTADAAFAQFKAAILW